MPSPIEITYFSDHICCDNHLTLPAPQSARSENPLFRKEIGGFHVHTAY